MDDIDPRSAFGAKIKAWREEKALSQAELDTAIGKARGFIAQTETGRLKPPGRELCEAIGRALGRPPGEVWSCAAPERLRDFDEDLATWHTEAVNEARGWPISDAEAWLMIQVRAIQGDIATPADDLAWWLGEGLRDTRTRPDVARILAEDPGLKDALNRPYLVLCLAQQLGPKSP